MTDERNEGAVSNVLDVQGDLVAQIEQQMQSYLQLLNTGQVEAATETAIRVIEFFEQFATADLAEEDKEQLAVTVELWSAAMFYARAQQNGMHRNFEQAASDFQSALDAANRVLARFDIDEAPALILIIKNLAPMFRELSAGSEAVFRGAPIEAVRRVRRAEQIVSDLLADTSELPEESHAPVYLGFLISATGTMTGASSVDAAMDQALAFFERHQERLEHAGAASGDDAPADDPVLYSILTMVKAFVSLVLAKKALLDRAFNSFDEHLASSGKLFDEVSLRIPNSLPQAQMIRDICTNLAMTALPQLRQQADREKALTQELELLRASNAKNAEELKEAIASKDRIFTQLLQPVRDITITNNVETTIQNTISMAVKLQDRGADAVLHALDELGDKIDVDQAAALRAQAEDAKNEKDILAKVEKVAKLIETFGKIADTVADVVPYGRPVFSVLKRIFG